MQVVAISKKLQGSDLSGLELSKAKLHEADLRKADLQGANLSEANLSGTKYDADTKWPEDFDPVAAGAVLMDD